MKTALFALAAITVIALVFLYYQEAARRPGTIVLPAGNTYLGPKAADGTSAP